MKKKSGFTLLEVLIVVVIAVTVVTFSVPVYKKTQERNKFLAARGALMEVGNAVRALRIDLQNVGQDITNAPASPKQLTSSHQKTTNSTYKAIAGYSSLSELSLTDTKFAYALFAREYMQPIQFDTGTSQFKGYSLFLCPMDGNGAGGCCRTTNQTVACIRRYPKATCKTSDFKGAYMKADGTIEDFAKGDTTYCS